MTVTQKTWILAVGFSLIAVAFAVIIPGTIYTSSSQFCSSCHEMRPEFLSWRRSTHKTADCISCHGGLGWQGYAKTKVKGAIHTYKHFFGFTKVVRGKLAVEMAYSNVEDAVCRQCHDYRTSRKKPWKQPDDQSVLQSPLHELHRDKIRSEYACNTCHAGIVHGSLSGGLPPQPDYCIACHQKGGIMIKSDFKRQYDRYLDGK